MEQLDASHHFHSPRCHGPPESGPPSCQRSAARYREESSSHFRAPGEFHLGGPLLRAVTSWGVMFGWCSVPPRLRTRPTPATALLRQVPARQGNPPRRRHPLRPTAATAPASPAASARDFLPSPRVRRRGRRPAASPRSCRARRRARCPWPRRRDWSGTASSPPSRPVPQSSPRASARSAAAWAASVSLSAALPDSPTVPFETAYARAACGSPSNIRPALLPPPDVAGGVNTDTVLMSTTSVLPA